MFSYLLVYQHIRANKIWILDFYLDYYYIKIGTVLER
jgi:hypothetical protein